MAFGYIETRLSPRPKESGEWVVDGEEVRLGVPGHMHDFIKMSISLGRTGTVGTAGGILMLLRLSRCSYITGHTLEVTGGMGI